MPKFTIITLGCKVNQYESAGLVESLKSYGWEKTPAGGSADLCIINTCTVTGKASMQARQAVRRAVRTHPDARIVVTGCYAQTEPEALAEIEGVEAVIGQATKHNIPKLIGYSEITPQPRVQSQCTDIHQERSFKGLTVSTFDSRTRPFLKVQDGCNAFCTYCIVPYARGRSRSMPADRVLENLLRYQTAGYREVVLTGIHLGYYGQDLSPATDLRRLLERIEASGFKGRIRLSSIEPLELTDEIIHIVGSSDKFCHHFHVPLQSGDNTILKRMHRPYTSELFGERVAKIIDVIPDAAIGVDTLIGFPGEDQAAFENSYNLIRELPVAYLHVFPYSRRKGTPAHDYPDQVPTETSKLRCEKMRILGGKKRAEFYHRGLGKRVDVLVESQRDNVTGLLKGLTSNYMPVLIDGEDSLKENIVNVTVDRIDYKLLIYGSLK
ncbi:MAG: tRNA (N(6)-L-threonylcarbamoyladenosine(37)-C(2))-methylthiotransferase MtaB [Desulfobacterales bacterium]|nr:tRNA (N(6)-L-threonylcarbamoyladenosine(37)-C(2))-methylthiotransferase MtaB [Desulfobacterales bacterium]